MIYELWLAYIMPQISKEVNSCWVAVEVETVVEVVVGLLEVEEGSRHTQRYTKTTNITKSTLWAQK